MINNSHKDAIERELEEFCNYFINLFDEMLEKGVISHNEYQLHTKVKKSFIENRNSISYKEKVFRII